MATMLARRAALRLAGPARPFRMVRAFNFAALDDDDQFSKEMLDKVARKALFSRVDSVEEEQHVMKMLGGMDPNKWEVDPRSASNQPQRWWHVDGRVKEAIWKLHSGDPKEWDIQHLSDKFGLHEKRVAAILKLKRIEKEEWKPEELHYDMEEAVESAIELYKLEDRVGSLPKDHEDRNRLEMAHELIYNFFQAQNATEEAEQELKKAADEDREILESQRTKCVEKQAKTWKELRNHLRPSLDEPFEDYIVFGEDDDASESMLDLAVRENKEVPEHGPGSGKLISTADKGNHLPNRHRIVITDISSKGEKRKREHRTKVLKQKQMHEETLQVVVREVDGSLRYPTNNEMERAVQTERCVKRDRRIVYTE